MKTILLLFLSIMTQNAATMIFDFTNQANLKQWKIVDDVVMGGVSSGKISTNEDGHGQFEGTVSLENNGGFSSLRFDCGPIKADDTRHIRILLKGDGKEYQLRVKDKTTVTYSYILPFKTTGEWETITIALKDMYPSFRGRKLSFSNYDKERIEELALLIGNGKNENFKLVIDNITLE